MTLRNVALGATALALSIFWGGGAWAQSPATGQPQGGAVPVQLQDNSESASDKASPAPELRPFCTDRPTKSNGACTVDQGHFQIESDLFNATFMRQDEVTTDTYQFTNPTLKYGLTHTSDIEVNWAPYATVRTHDTRAGTTDTVSGVGDLYLRAKLALVGDDGGVFAATLFPYVKAPTARMGIGDGAWEGGLIVPLVVKLSNTVNLSFDPEVDLLENASGSGRHPSMAQLIDLSWSLPKNVTVFGELWSNVNFDPAGTVTQYSADLSASWGFADDLQFDGGINIGLNRVTPAVQIYTGISRRF